MFNFIRINMSDLTAKIEIFPKEWLPLGGRALIDKIMTEELEHNVNPLSSESILILAPGFLTGTTIPNSGRMSIGGKSPLTSGIKESNVGGAFGQRLARLKIKALIIQGKPKEGLYYIIINNDKVIFERADKETGLGNYKLVEFIRSKYGDDVSVASIGPCGENMMAMSSIAVADPDGYPSRHAARGGLGAVMGAKRVKAIIVKDSRAPVIKPVWEDKFKESLNKVIVYLKEHPRIPFFTSLGTAGLVEGINKRGSLPTYNYKYGSFEKASNISGEKIKELIEKRGGSTGHACMPGCVVRCSNVFNDENGNYVTSALEYETIGMLGANLGIDDIDKIALLNRRCNDFGIDTIETGSAIGVLSEVGHFNFGDSERALDLVDEIGKNTLLGKVLGQGVVVTCKVFSIDRVPAVKSQALPAHDPRYLKGLGVTYATSPQGADHTAGYVPDENTTVGQAEKSKIAQENIAILDSSGLCYYSFMTGQNELIASLTSALYGINCTEADMVELGRRALTQERNFNNNAGFSAGSDKLPSFLEKEILKPTNTVFDVPLKEIGDVFNIE